MRYYTRNIGDLAAATRGLDLLHRGAYDALLDAYYLLEQPLPLDHRECYLLADARSPAERRAVDDIIARFFERCEDGYRQRRCDRELARIGAKSEKARASAEARWSKSERNANASANAMRTHAKRNATQYPIPNTQAPTLPTLPTPSAPVAPVAPVPGGVLTPPEPPEVAAPKPRRAARNPPGNREAKSTPVWQAYAEAYRLRYGVEPVRNAKANALLAQFVDRLGGDESPAVAAWYVAQSRGLYVAAKHAIDLLLRDAEGLRTEWATGRAMTDTQARQADRTAAIGNTFGRLIESERTGTNG